MALTKVDSQLVSGAITTDSSGNVGIGTASPSTKFHVQTTGGNLEAIRADNATVSDGVGLYLRTTGQAGISWGTGGYLGFYGNGPGSAERMRIETNGNLLVQTTDQSAQAGVGFKVLGGGVVSNVTANTTNSTFTYRLYSTGAAAYRFYVGHGGTVYATATTITGISDQRVKENIADLDDGLDAVMALKPRKFDWKAGKGRGIKGDRGFIAQEFEQVFPDMIEEWADPAPEGEEPYKAVNANLIPTLVKAIQELNAKVDAQALEIQALKGTA